MARSHLLRVPPGYYQELKKVQDRLMRERGVFRPLWECIEDVETERKRWRDDTWFKI